MKKTLTITMLIASAVFAFAENDVPATDVPANDAPVLGPAPANAPDAELSEIEKIRAEMHKDPMKTIPVFVNAARHMKTAIDEDAAIIAQLKLADTDIENMPPEEQFELIANALNTVPETPAQKRAAIEKVFGPHNAELVDFFVSDKTRTEYASSQLREAHVLFSEYVTPTDVDNWGWGKSKGFNANLTAGTLGIGLDLGYEINKHWKIRGHYGRGSLSGTIHIHDANIDASWENNDNVGVFLDWHPKGSQFHATIGLMYSNPKIKLWGTYSATADYIKLEAADGANVPNTSVAGATASKLAENLIKSGVPEAAANSVAAGIVADSAKYSYDVESHYKMDGSWDNKVQPYVGIGWSSDGGKDRTLYFTFDIGLLYVGPSSYEEDGSYEFYRVNNYRIDPATGKPEKIAIATGTSKHGAGPTWNNKGQGFTTDVDDSGQIVIVESDIPAASALQRMDGNIRNVLDKVAGFLDDMYVYPVIQFGGGIRF